jgi:tetratricopeptide (TPR) repeat protein
LSTSPVVPSSIYSLIQARLAQLSDAARRVLDAGVAAGRVFEFDVVARAAGLSDEAALDALDELRTARLITPQGADGASFAFDHTLTMEVAYREIGEPRHRRLHRRVAEAMEALYGRQYLDGISGLVAWHFAEGGDDQRAAPYALRAAQLAMNLAAWQEAIGFYKQALVVNQSNAQRAETLLALGQAHFRTGETAQASEAFRAALRLCEPTSAEANEARLALARALLNQAKYAEVIDLAQQVCSHAAHAGDPTDQRISAQLLWGTALSIEGVDLTQAAEHLQTAEQLLRQADRPDVARLAQSIFEQGSVAAQQGDLERAVALYREALGIARQSNDPEAQIFQVLGNNNLAYHLNLLGDPTAIENAQAGLQLVNEYGLPGLRPFVLSTLGEIMLASGELDRAEGYFNDALAWAGRLSFPERLAGLTANLGRVAHRRGETALAIHRLSTALAQADSLNLKHLGAQIRLWLAPLLPPQEARLRLAEVRALAESSGRKRMLEEALKLEKELGTV